MSSPEHGGMRAFVTRASAPLACLLLVALLADVRVLALVIPLALGVAWRAPKRLSRAAELGIYAACILGVVLAVRGVGLPRGGIATAIALAAFVLAGARALLLPNAAAKGGDLALVIVAAAALGALGQRMTSTVPVATALAGVALARDPAFAPRVGARAWGIALGFVVIAGATGVAASWGIPWATYAAARRLTAYMRERPRSGFDESLSLGDASPILESDKLVLRVTGDEVDYLRGKVYQTFDGTQWLGLNGFGTFAQGAPGARARHVHVESAEKRAIQFAPLGFVVTGGRTRADGISRSAKLPSWDAVEHEGFALPPPSTDDLQVPRALTLELRELAVAWTAGATSDAEKLEAIERNLRAGYRYTLTRESFRGSAIRDFLFGHKAGHCELFATAFTLVARSAGVPARVVGGYRVLERAQAGDGFVVRERNAHAWVEAYSATATTGPAWRTWDPTPPSAFLHRASTMETALESMEDLLGEATKPRNLVALLGIAGAVVALVAARRARAARRTRVAVGATLHPELLRLEAHLARRGIERAPAEGLLTFAVSLEERGHRAEADAVRACAALRYGGEGTLEGLRAQVSACIAEPPARAAAGE